MKRISKFILLAIAAILAVLASGAVVYAASNILRGDTAQPVDQAFQPERPQPPSGGPGLQGPRAGGPQGEVSALDDSSLTLLTTDGQSLPVLISDKTIVRLLASQSEGSLSDILIGNQVQVRGRPDEDGVLQAQVIVVLPQGERLGGKVTAVSGKTISVENRQGQFTILTDDATQFQVGRQAGSLGDVSAGLFVQAFGELQADGSLAAALVTILDAPQQGGPQGAQPGGDPQGGFRLGGAPQGGRVASVEGNAITVENPQGQTVIVTNADTRFEFDRKESSLNDVSAGRFVLAFGEVQADGSLLATLVIVHDRPPQDAPGVAPDAAPGQGSPSG